MIRKEGSTFLHLLARAYGVYYLITGIWPLVSRKTFEKVTGPFKETYITRLLAQCPGRGGIHRPVGHCLAMPVNLIFFERKNSCHE